MMLPVLLSAGSFKYPVYVINDSLKKNAHAVIREHHTEIEYIDKARSRCYVHYAVTILNQKAEEQADEVVFYSEGASRVDFLRIHIFDGLGKEITKDIKNTDVSDESAIDDGIMYSDDRIKRISPTLTSFPVTVEYEYQVTYNAFGFAVNTRWLPIQNYNTSLEWATLTIKNAPGLTPTFMEINIPKGSEEVGKSSKIYHKWSLDRIPAFSEEAFSPPILELIPNLMIRPAYLVYNSYELPYDSWSNFGKFNSYLNSGRDELPAATVAAMKAMASATPDKKELIQKIYRFMQKKTRYVGVEDGIGGWQTATATFVDTKGYGDCKGLVNYTYALLKAAGVESVQTLAKAGRDTDPIISDFSGNQFNHVILCVPLEKDSIWLECTDQEQPFGFLGSFTNNRDVLLLKENDSKLVRTPEYGLNLNKRSRKAEITLDKSGNIHAKSNAHFYGLAFEEIERLKQMPAEEKKKDFRKKPGMADAEIIQLNYSFGGGIIPEGDEATELNIYNYASVSQNRLFLPLILFSPFKDVPATGEKRQYPVFVRNSKMNADTLVYAIPEGLKIEFKPEDILLESIFGKYSLKTEIKDNQIHVYRTFAIYRKLADASTFTDLTSFLRKVAKADATKIVLTTSN